MRPSPRTASSRRLTALATTALLAAAALAAQGETRPDPSGIEVTASAREVRIAFPRDPGPWGWSAPDSAGDMRWYLWGAHGSGTDGPFSFYLSVAAGDYQARSFPSLDSLVAAAPPLSVCDRIGCTQEGVEVRVRDGRVVVLLRDSSNIARWFGLRPDSLVAQHRRPGPIAHADRTVPIEYVNPQIPLPDASLRAEAALNQRRYDRARHTLHRVMEGGYIHESEIWVQVGDTVPLNVVDRLCDHDICRHEPVEGGRWAVEHPGIAGLGERWLTGVMPGRTRLRVTRLPPVRDTMLSRDTVPRVLERTIVVVPPVARVEFLPPPPARVGEAMEVHAIAYDREGRVIAGAPIEVWAREAGYMTYAPGPFRWIPPYARTYTVTARFLGAADTVMVTARER